MILAFVIALMNLVAGSVCARWADNVGQHRPAGYDDQCEDEYHLASACSVFHFLNFIAAVRVSLPSKLHPFSAEFLSHLPTYEVLLADARRLCC